MPIDLSQLPDQEAPPEPSAPPPVKSQTPGLDLTALPDQSGPSTIDPATAEVIPTITQGQPAPFMEPFWNMLKSTTAEQKAKATNSLSMASELGIPPSVAYQNYDALSEKMGMKGVPTTKELTGALMVPPIAAGFATAPVATLVGLAGFQALSEVESAAVNLLKGEKYQVFHNKGLSSFLPEDASQLATDVVDTIDLIGKGVALGVGFKRAPKIVERLTKEVIETYNMPRELYVNAAELKAELQTGGVLDSDTMTIIKDLGLTSSEWRDAVTSGIVVRVPAEKITTWRDKPWYAAVKKLLKIDPFQQTTVTKTGETTHGRPVSGQIEGATEAPAPVIAGASDFVEEAVTAIEANPKITDKEIGSTFDAATETDLAPIEGGQDVESPAQPANEAQKQVTQEAIKFVAEHVPDKMPEMVDKAVAAGFELGSVQAFADAAIKSNTLGEKFPASLELIQRHSQRPGENIDVKTQIREATGQVKDQAQVMTELGQLKRAYIMAGQAARKAFSEGNKQGVETEKARMKEILQRAKDRSGLTAAITKLRKTADKLSESESVSVDYRNLIKEVIGQYELKGHTEETIKKLRETQRYLNRASDQGEDVEMPQRVLDKLAILARTPKERLTPSIVQGLQQEIDLLGKLGRTKQKSKKALYEAEKEARKNELLSSGITLPGYAVPPPPIGGDTAKMAEWYNNARNYIQATGIALTPIDGLAEMTGMKPMKAALDADFANYLSFNDKAIEGWYDLTKDFNKGNFERIGAYALSKQEGGLQRLMNSGRTEEEVKAIRLTPEEMKAYRYVRENFDRLFPDVKKYARDVYNADVGQVDNYVSFMSDYDSMSDLEIFERFGRHEIPEHRTKTVEQGFTKSRAAASKIKLELNIDKIFRRHMDDVAYMLTMGRDIKQYSEIVNSPEMKEKLGDPGALAWLQWLDLMARKGGVDGAKRIAALDWMRKNTGVGILAFRLTSALVQLTSFTDSVATIGAEWATRGAAVISDPAWREFILKNFPEVRKAIGDDVAFREMDSGYFEKMARVGMEPLRILDGLMRSSAAAGAYLKLAAEKGVEVDLANPDPALVQEATRLMRHSQGSSFFKDQPLAITAGKGLTENLSVNKVLLQFQSFMLNRWDNIKRQIWREGIKKGDYKKAVTAFMWIIIVSAALEEGFRRTTRAGINAVTGAPPPKNQSSFAEGVGGNIVGSVPLLGQIASAITYGSNPVPIIKATEDAIQGVGTVVKGKSSTTKAKGAVKAVGAAGSMAGVPGASQAAQIVEKSLSE